MGKHISPKDHFYIHLQIKECFQYILWCVPKSANPKRKQIKSKYLKYLVKDMYIANLNIQKDQMSLR